MALRSASAISSSVLPASRLTAAESACPATEIAPRIAAYLAPVLDGAQGLHRATQRHQLDAGKRPLEFGVRGDGHPLRLEAEASDPRPFHPGGDRLDGPDRDLFYGSYLQTYLQRDLRDLARVGDELAFQRFLRGAAARTGQLFNVADLARDADVAPNTARSWLSILEASGLVYLLPPWHGNLGKRLLKTPKLYFLDTGLCAYLTQWSSPETLEAGAMSGAVLESWVVAEILKSYWHQGRLAPFYYYRDKDQREIDLVI